MRGVYQRHLYAAPDVADGLLPAAFSALIRPRRSGFQLRWSTTRRLDEADPQSNDQRGFQTDDFSA